jgi:glyoxalase/bleomycin resistance protein/dioxygenase superfamily protein
MSADRAYVEGLVPFVHVRDVVRSTAFYERFGFEVRNTYEADGRLVWCWLERHRARVMLAQADAPVIASQQAVLFYVYAHDLEELHSGLEVAGLEPGPIEPGAPGPDRQFRVFDPDGYCLMVTDAAALEPPPRVA